ncbi:MAG: hypothetical protein EB125_13025, partial [Betaproteobacteria bacterium]|nr:hypothetical protein [Betaproteobacteria bacterium]
TGFQAGFKPENVPHINLPDVPQDATGLPPEALAHIPTLTERVPAASEDEASPAGDTLPVLEVLPEVPTVTEAQPPEAADALSDATEVAEQTQEPQVEADTWVEQMQVRMDRLMDDIHTLNDRLDRLENKTKV